jgi:uncharacterized membrane protein YgaE (UPF0421/DUF939 family)
VLRWATSLLDVNRHTLTSGAGLALRAALGAVLSYAVAEFVGLQHPIFALVAAIIVTDFVPKETTRLGTQRLVATVFGAMCGVLLRALFEPSGGSVGFGILVSMLACYLTKARDGAKAAGYVAAIIMLEQGEDPLSYGLFRFAETALGISVAWLLSLVPRLIQSEDQTTAGSSSRPLTTTASPTPNEVARIE